MKSVFYNEFDPNAASWLRELVAQGHISSGEVDERSIKDIDHVDADTAHFFAGIGGWDYALKLAGWPTDRPVWTGSCPCQPFSSAGKGLGTADPRHLWPDFARLIRERRPPVVFGEQVASAAGRGWLARVRADLEAMGYAVGAADLCAAGAGAPHIRQRLYWVAYTQRKGFQGGIQQRTKPPAKFFATNTCETVQAEQGRKARYGGSPFPLLDHGIPRDVAASVGFGNAIVPQVAAIFIKAFMESSL